MTGADLNKSARPFLESTDNGVEVDVTRGYPQTLRAIGQALETLNLGNFIVEPDGDGYRVSQVAASGNQAVAWRRDSLSMAIASREQFTAAELTYSPSDVDRLERHGRAQRLKTHASTDSARLSQALRVIGCYLNQKCSRMLRVSRWGDNFEVHYETSLDSC